jgi:hypothetical protein
VDSNAADETSPPCDPVWSDRGAAWNERDNGPVAEPGVSEQDLKKAQNCRSELRVQTTSDEPLFVDVRLPMGPGNGSDRWPNATLALPTPSQGGSPRTGISQATRAYLDEKSASIEDAVCGGIGTKEG